MSDQLFAAREMASSTSSFSPKSSPRGSRSPMAAPASLPRHDSTGTLKMTISAGKHPAVVNSGPFYLMKEPAAETELTGATNLMGHYGLEHSYSKFTGKKVKDSLSSFLPSLPGILDTPAHLTNSSLQSLIEKPPVFKEFVPLNHHQLAGFRLQHGPLPEQYRFQSQPEGTRRHRHQKKGDPLTPSYDPQSNNDFPLSSGVGLTAGSAGGVVGGVGVAGSGDGHEKKPHKKKKNDDERKKKKKEKKKKKQRHSPEHGGVGGGSGGEGTKVSL
ncbi:mediator of RNA polymerase II transcription subunit 19 isoform X2 [Hyalella azteca]|uniref:Mediator of RNA polymerase II transcription subunit 19 n=1 Tax=Hyalella azteca TaxID=294128 RepID=A0A8B7P0B2_HYAAZ|nr:mediator of RNA polymerase II transcription subunit 19 isoform X2 [Hyalella azteca]